MNHTRMLLLGVLACGLGPALPAQATKVVQGRILDSLGNSYTGVHVEAWDRDGGLLGSDDLIGSSGVDSNGRYSIAFTKVGWDGPRTRRHTSWRPDIFIKVLNGSNVELARSSVHTNWKLRNSPLTIDLQLPPAQHEVGFTVRLHGFHFTNSFSWWQLGYGLCGGMSRDAADRYVNGDPVPAQTTPPAENTALWDRLYKKQVESLDGAGGVARILWWQSRYDQDIVAGFPPLTWVVRRSIGFHTKKQIDGLKEKLLQDIPVPLMVIRAQPTITNFPWDNHQVLAIGYRTIQPDGIEIHVYDPNEPNEDDVWLRVDLSDRATNDIHGAQLNRGVITDPMRGFYVIDGPDRAAPRDTANAASVATDERGAAFYGDFNGDGYRDSFEFDSPHNRMMFHASNGRGFDTTEASSIVVDLPDLSSEILAFTGRFLEGNKDSVLLHSPSDRLWRLLFLDPFTGDPRIDTLGGDITLGDMVERGFQFFQGDFQGDGLEELLIHDAGTTEQPGTNQWRLLSAATGSLNWSQLGTLQLDLLAPTNFAVGRFLTAQTHAQLLVAPASGPWRLLSIDALGNLTVVLVTPPMALGALTRDEILWVDGDFDGDGVAEVMVYDRGGQSWHRLRLVGNSVQATLVATTPALTALHNESALVSPGDFDGNGTIDLMVFRVADQTWHLGTLSGPGLTFQQVGQSPGTDPDGEMLLVGRFTDPGRDSIGFANRVTGNHRLFTLSAGTLLERRMLDVTPLGRACQNPLGYMPAQTLSGQPLAGGSVTLRLRDAAPNSVCFLVIGYSDTSSNGVPLPISLGAYGGPSQCDQQVSLSVVYTLQTDAVGRAERTVRIPPGAEGVALRTQFVVVDPLVSQSLPVLVSEGLRWRVH